MTILEAMEEELCDLRETKEDRRPMYNIHFTNDDGEMDETQFTCECEETAGRELEDFFKGFCEENGYEPDAVNSIDLLYDDAP